MTYRGETEDVPIPHQDAHRQPRPNSLFAADPLPSLDTQETSVIANNDVSLDENSLPSRFRHSGWRPIRARVWAGLVRTCQPAGRLKAFANCGSHGWLQRSNEPDQTPTGPQYRYRIAAQHCKDRLCIPCANARSALIRERLQPLIEGKRLLFITFTLCGKGEGLRELVDKLYKSFRALRHHPVFSEKITGGAAFLEIKWSDKAQRWHPHFHVIADGRYIDQGELSDAWRSITKDSYIVDIQREHDLERVQSYVTKYASKPLNSSFLHDPDRLDEAIMALKGRRLCTCFYTWYGTPLSRTDDEELADDIIDAAGYSNVEPLHVFLERSLDGNPIDRQVIDALNCEARWRILLTLPPPPEKG